MLVTTLGSTILRASGIYSPHELYLLRWADLWSHVHFPDLNLSKTTPRLPKRVTEGGSQAELLRMPPSIFIHSLREMRVDPRPWLLWSKIDKRLRGMQKKMVA